MGTTAWVRKVSKLYLEDYQGLTAARQEAREFSPDQRRAAAYGLWLYKVDLDVAVWLLASRPWVMTYEQLWWLHQKRYWRRKVKWIINSLW